MKEAWILISIFAFGIAQLQYYPVTFLTSCSCSSPYIPEYVLLPQQTIAVHSNSGQQCPPNDLNANKVLAMKAYQEALGDLNVSNLELYFHQDYIQHNPFVADGLEGFRQGILGPLGQRNKTKLDFRRVSADDDLVWLHSRQPSDDKVFAVVDIFRIECGKIKEHWDVIQEIDSNMTSANPHPFF